MIVLARAGLCSEGTERVDAGLCVFLEVDVVPSRGSTVRAILMPLFLEPQTYFVKTAFDRHSSRWHGPR
jgi:hypothetical protein